MKERIGNKNLDIFLFEEDLKNIEKEGKIKDTFYNKDNEEQLKTSIKFNKSKTAPFIDVRPFLIKNFLDIEKLKISFNEDAINHLKNGNGMISYGDLFIYSHKYIYFNILYNSSK